MASLTLLQLLQEFADKVGVNRAGLTAVTSVTGELLRLRGYLIDAEKDIQAEHPDWRFLKKSTSWATIDGQAEYTTVQCGITDGEFGQWDLADEFRVYHTVTGLTSEIELTRRSYEFWRAVYQIGANRTAKSQPINYCLLPNDGLGLGPVPLAGYTITAPYFRSPLPMAVADATVSIIPAKHDHMIIVYKAMMKYALYESAPEVFKEGSDEYTKRLGILENDQLPKICVRGVL